jgi:hypothetical protein
MLPGEEALVKHKELVGEVPNSKRDVKLQDINLVILTNI